MPIQSTEQSEKIQLAEMPREILERILIYLDYKNLLTASHVSKLFASIAETAFERKNKNEHYKIIQHQENKADVVMLNKYGEKMQKVTIIRCEEKWLDLVQEKCRNLKGLSLIGVPKIIMLKNLKEVSLDGIQNLDRDTFLEFIDNNPDIESLALKYIDVDLLSILDNRLHMLKMFTFCTENNIDSLDDLPTIRLNSLKTLDLELMESEAKSCKQLFRAIKCDKLENLYVDTFKLYYEDESDDAINGICKFETLVSLSLWYPIKSNQILTLAAHFPDLITFEVVIAEGESNFENLVHSILSMLPKLETLRIMLDENNNDRLLIELKSSTNDFHARFAKSNIKIGLDSEKFYVYGITKDYLSFFCDGSFEIHWMQNLNENRVRSMMTQYHFQPRVKFVNNCADRDFDISTLGKVHKGFVSMEYLDFKSNGPISVDSNVSEILSYSKLN